MKTAEGCTDQFGAESASSSATAIHGKRPVIHASAQSFGAHCAVHRALPGDGAKSMRFAPGLQDPAARTDWEQQGAPGHMHDEGRDS